MEEFLVVKESISGNTEKTVTFTEPMRSIFLINDGNEDVTVIVRDIEITLKAGEPALNEAFDRFTSLSISGTTPLYRGWVRG